MSTNPLPMHGRRTARRRIWRWAACALLGWFGAGTASALYVTWPWNSEIGQRSTLGRTAIESVSVRAADGVVTRGWLCEKDPARCVLLAAGIRRNRCTLLSRGEWWLDQGWSVLLVDLRGTGASDPAPISIGWHEAQDLAAWRTFLRDRGFTRIGVHAQSLAAAAVTYATPFPGTWDFAVLEGCYDNVRNALYGRLWFVPWPRVLLWPMVLAAELRLHVDADDLNPVTHAAQLHGPVLLLAGDADDKSPRAGTEALFAALPDARKLLRWIQGAGHVDLWLFDATACQSAILEFLRRV